MRDIKAVFDIGNDSIKAIVFGKDNEAFTTTINKIVENFSKKLGGDFIEEVVVGVSHPEMLVNRIIEGKRIMQAEV